MRIVKFMKWLWMTRNEIHFRRMYIFAPLFIIIIGGIVALFAMFRKRITHDSGTSTFFSKVEDGSEIIKRLSQKYATVNRKFIIKAGSTIIHQWSQIGLKIKTFVIDQSKNVQQFTMYAGDKLMTFWVDDSGIIRQISIGLDRVMVETMDDVKTDLIKFGQTILHSLEEEASGVSKLRDCMDMCPSKIA